MKTLYLECYSGISGDMTVAALLDLGADKNVLLSGLKSLNAGGYDIKINRTKKCGIDACDFDVILHGDAQGHHHEEHRHDNGNVHTHGHSHDHDHEHATHAHDHGYSHTHTDSHEHGHTHTHEDSHEHRNIDDIFTMIEGSEITDKAKITAKKIFEIVAKAESAVHGLPVSEVHFHEVGAVDSIIDIVGTAICLDNLGIGRVVCTPLREGQGTVKCQHGRVPVPAPATLKIIESYNIPLVITQNQGEMVTPTGAAIVAALTENFSPAEDLGAQRGMMILKIGYGAGKKDFASANVLRASIVAPIGGPESCAGKGTANTDSSKGDFSGSGYTDEVQELSCNIDDMTGEHLAYACELVMKKGAYDCWLTPIIMKKGRPAQTLSLLIDPLREDEFTRLLFQHTSTIGVRITPHRRSIMNRRPAQIETIYGSLDVKECSYDDICKIGIEYESAKILAESHNIPISHVYRAVEIAQK